MEKNGEQRVVLGYDTLLLVYTSRILQVLSSSRYKIRQQVIHACKKSFEFSLISCSDHILRLSFSFGCLYFLNKNCIDCT